MKLAEDSSSVSQHFHTEPRAYAVRGSIPVSSIHTELMVIVDKAIA